MKRYFHRKGRWKLGFVDRLDKRKPSLVKLSELKIQRHLKVDWKYRVYDGDPETIEYWQRREYFKGRNSFTLGSVGRISYATYGWSTPNVIERFIVSFYYRANGKVCRIKN